jgi:signal transduction histidine kinase
VSTASEDQVHARRLAELEQQLAEAREQLTATSDVLGVISRSPGELDKVFQAMLANATRLCAASFGSLFLREGDAFRLVAWHNTPPAYVEARTRVPHLRPPADSPLGRVAMTKEPYQVADMRTSQSYLDRHPFVVAAVEAAGYRTILGVPILKDDELIGAFTITRREVRLFTDRQIELVKNFAAQAVIAIENARLLNELRRRTDDLSESLQEVADKSRELELASQYKSHFLASASHDLRQPLHALNLFVAQLHSEANPAERSRLVGRIDAAVGSMNELFEALLDMTKLEAGILKPSPAEFPIARLLGRIETTFADAARKKGLRLRVVGSSGWVASDPILLERILLNLVSNAVRYTDRGGVVIGCRRHGEKLRIDVCDTGAGIPEDQRQNIFGEFFRLVGSGRDGGSGLGLGLAIVDRLGRLLGHPVELGSRPGRGSRFSVSVPLAPHPLVAWDTPAPAAAIPDPARGKRIIVIDDDALVLDGMRGILQSWGCQVETATSGDAALAVLTANGALPDLIISDSRLADGRTGIEAIERLRAAAGAPIPAFVITGDTAPERLREASAAGFHLLHKPVSPMALRTTLSRLLKAPVSPPGGGRP